MKPGALQPFVCKRVCVCTRGLLVVVRKGRLVGCMCVCNRLWIYALFCWQTGQFWNFGIWATDQEFSSWGVRRGGCGECLGAGGRQCRGPRGGVRMGCPSLPSRPPLTTFILQLSVSTLHSLRLKRQSEKEEEEEEGATSLRERKRNHRKRRGLQRKREGDTDTPEESKSTRGRKSI